MTELRPNHRPSERERLHAALDDFYHAMLITQDADGAPRGRPMALAERESSRLWFVTDAASGMVDEIRDDAHAAVTMQGPSGFVSMTGTARLVHDEAKLRHVWTSALEPWFPEGPNAPGARLIRFDPQHAEIWDVGLKEGLRFLWDAAKAVAKGERANATKRAELSAN